MATTADPAQTLYPPRPSVAPHGARTKRWKAPLAALLVLLAVVGTIVGIKALQVRAMVQSAKRATPPLESVTSASATEMEWEVSTPTIGSVVAEHAGTLGAELPGIVREIDFDSGASVKRGAVLVRLDTSVEEANLASARADAALAQRELERARSLRLAKTNTQSDLDLAEARAQQANASVLNVAAVIAKKTIRAPFDGRIAIRQVELGQSIGPSTTIASLQSVTPIFVDFWLPQRALEKLAVGQAVRLELDSSPKRSWSGSVTTINPEVDVATRNVRIRATFANDDGELRPGMFCNVAVVSKEKTSVVAIPAMAVLYAPYGDSVFVLEKEAGKDTMLAKQRFVRLGQRRGDFIAVVSGLQPGATIVSSGAFKLHGDTRVVVNNAISVDPGATPAPSAE